jgi:vesicle-fusing ATPase
MMALDEVHPAFGVSEEELEAAVSNGIIYYDDNVRVRTDPRLAEAG